MLWKIVIVLGILYLAYFFGLRVYTKRWNTSFSLFWLGFGLTHLILAIIIRFAPKVNAYVLVSVLGCIYVLFLVTLILILSKLFGKPQMGISYLVVLGAQVRGTRVTQSLKRRLDCALSYMNENPDTVAVVSGGQGKGEDISEAEAMQTYLHNRGIAINRIIKEERSTSTWENLVFSGELIGDLWKPVGIVTNNFHVYRSLILAGKIGYLNAVGMPASSNPVVFFNYLIRECVALWHHFLISASEWLKSKVSQKKGL